MKKASVICVILLFLGMSVTSPIGISNDDDTTPPVTTCTLDPPEPNGLNGWYVSDVTVTLNATDDISGVKEIYFRLAEGEWLVKSGDTATLLLPHDCLIDGIIEFYAVDYADNQEEIKSVEDINIDQITPFISISYEVTGGNLLNGYDILWVAEATDACSGMNGVEFHAYTRYNSYFLGNFSGPGPIYECRFCFSPIKSIRGYILFKEITEEYVNFFALLVLISAEIGIFPHVDAYDNAGNTCWVETGCLFDDRGICLFSNVKLPNNFKGYIGKYFIFAEFDEYLITEEGRLK